MNLKRFLFACFSLPPPPKQQQGKEGNDESVRARDERKCCLGLERKRKSDSKVNRKRQSVEC